MAPTLLHLLDLEVEHFKTGICQHPLLSKLVDGTITIEEYVCVLRNLYLLDAAVNRLPISGLKQQARPQLAGLLTDRFRASLEEEAGHENVLLHDLRQLGGDQVAMDAGPEQFFTSLITDHPEHWLGIGYLLEVTASRLFPQIFDALVAANQIPQEAMSWLKLHALVDQEHAVYWQQTAASANLHLSLQEKESIAAAARATTEYVLARYPTQV